MKAAPSKPRLGSRGRPEESRAAILQAAVQEFSREGVAGARTDAIARAAASQQGPALLLLQGQRRALRCRARPGVRRIDADASAKRLSTRPASPREKLLAYVGAHFDYIASHPLYPRIVQGEMMRAGRGRRATAEAHREAIFSSRCSAKLAAVIEEGQATGEFRPVRSHAFRSLHDRRHRLLFHQRAGDAHDERNRSAWPRS